MIYGAATVTLITSSETTVELLPITPNRVGADIYNDSNQPLYIKYGINATTDDYSLKIPADGYFELPNPCYVGIVSGVWGVQNGYARVTEWVR